MIWLFSSLCSIVCVLSIHQFLCLFVFFLLLSLFEFGINFVWTQKFKETCGHWPSKMSERARVRTESKQRVCAIKAVDASTKTNISESDLEMRFKAKLRRNRMEQILNSFWTRYIFFFFLIRWLTPLVRNALLMPYDVSWFIFMMASFLRI